MEEVIGRWQDWAGEVGWPFDPNTIVEVQLRSGITADKAQAGDWYWLHDGGRGDITAYRVLGGSQSDVTITTDVPKKHNHYFRDVSGLKVMDIYRFLELFNVTDPCLAHAIKKLVVPGMRGGSKDIEKDLKEAIDSIQRKLEMLEEDKQNDN